MPIYLLKRHETQKYKNRLNALGILYQSTKGAEEITWQVHSLNEKNANSMMRCEFTIIYISA